MRDIFKIGKYKFKSRLIVGTGKYKNFNETAKAVKASGADIVTVAVRRAGLNACNCRNFEFSCAIAISASKIRSCDSRSSVIIDWPFPDSAWFKRSCPKRPESMLGYHPRTSAKTA